MSEATEKESHGRRKKLTEDEVNAIKDQILESIYADIGRSLVKKFLWVVGSLAATGYIALQHKEEIVKLLK